ncbi:unnamed protein product, partial [Acanthocheilonema viteae]
SCRDTINCVIYSHDGFFHDLANDRDLLRVFASDEFLQHGGVVFVSSKRFAICCNSMLQIPILQTKSTCPTNRNGWF